ncbi:MAG: winged helix-turn-helix transcriptional regulator [Chloroflexi bacterium]|nr:winged helix-turn-helix transcriptional regulator [Chloroflexota bacterium]
MFRTDFVLAPRTVPVRVAVYPARTLINSMLLMNMADLRSGLSDWIAATAASFSPEIARDNHVAGILADMIPLSDEPLEFPDLIERMRHHDFADAVAQYIDETAEHMGVSVDELMANRATFVKHIVEHMAAKGEELDPEHVGAAFDMLQAPERCGAFLADHLQRMWDLYLADEWKRSRPVLYETVALFDQLDLTDLTPLEAIQAVTGRDMTNFLHNEEQINEIIFVPSLHTGPYVSHSGPDQAGRTYLIFGARVPEGIANVSTELSLRDLLTQLAALADDTRLHILSLLTQHNELCSQDFQHMLNLSQSAASRHLRQLVAAGYLNERRRDLNKCFSLNSRRVQETSATLRILLGRK